MSRKVNRHPDVTELVQSNARNFLELKRNFDHEGPGDRFSSDIDDVDDKGCDLGRVGSRSRSPYYMDELFQNRDIPCQND